MFDLLSRRPDNASNRLLAAMGVYAGHMGAVVVVDGRCQGFGAQHRKLTGQLGASSGRMSIRG